MKYKLISEESCSGSETAKKKESVSFCQLLFLFEFLLDGPYLKEMFLVDFMHGHY